MSMKYFVIFLVLIGFVGIVFAEETDFCPSGNPVIFNHTITNGKINSMCLDYGANAIILEINTTQNGSLTIDVPRKAINPTVTCEKDDDFFIIIDGKEVNYTEIKSTDKFRRLSFSFTSDSHEAEIIGINVGFQPSNCAYLYEYDRINISPLLQTKLGISSQNVICEIYLELIQKYDGTPACVKEKTKQKLIERGWIGSTTFENLDKSEITSRAEQLPEVQLFLEKYPDVKIKVDLDRSQVKYVEEKIVKTKYGDEKRRVYMQIQFDEFGNPSPHIIGCTGNNMAITETDDIMGQIQSDDC